VIPNQTCRNAFRAARWLAGLCLALALGHAPTTTAQQERDLASYVDPFIGTAPAPSTGHGIEFDGGDVFPGATYPLGMLYWSPDTAEHSIAGGYWYPDQSIKGFSLTHFSGRGCTAYLDVPLMPMNGHAEQRQASTFRHSAERAEPGSYRVRLDSGIDVELTTTARTGLGRFTYPSQAESSIVVDLGGSVNGVFDTHVAIDPTTRRVVGDVISQVGCGTDRYTVYFALEFDAPFRTFGTNDRVAYVTFDQSRVQVKSAISYVSVDGALLNLRTENPDWDFEALSQAARQAWNAVLTRAHVSGGSAEGLIVFYTALYHTFLHPNVFSDVDGSYRGFDDLVHRVAEGHAHYHNIPGWDQYRALIQWRAMLDPERTADIIQSLVDDAAQGGGGMPRWEQANRNSNGMVGDAPGAYVASAYAFGARSFDTRAALTALDLAGSTPGTRSGPHAVREYLADWLALGYVPDQPSISLEYAASDFGIAQLAQALGEQALADRYLQRAYGWSRAFDTAKPDAIFVEGNIAQYTWMVPFDVPGVAHRLGGRDVAIARLDDFFGELNAGPDRPYAWIGNQPSLWAPWAYAALGAPSKTHSVVRRIQSELFSATPGGLPGNDDGGTLSAWYVMSALGLFPSVPGVDSLVVGSPLFGDAVLDLGNGHTVHVVARGSGPYVSAVRLNGAPHDRSTITWRELRDAVLEIDRSVDEPVLAERDQE